MTYSAHHELLTIRVWSELHKRYWLISRKQYRLMCCVYSGRRFTIRSLMEETGYSLAGLHAALQSLVTGGLLIVRTRLGRHGWTFAKVRPGVVMTENLNRIRALVGNVRQLGTSSSTSSKKNVTVIANIQYDVFWEGSA